MVHRLLRRTLEAIVTPAIVLSGSDLRRPVAKGAQSKSIKLELLASHDL